VWSSATGPTTRSAGGVVFSDQTLGNLQAADAPSAAEILDAFNHWDDIAVNIRGHRIVSSGHGFCGIGRKRLLNILQKRCEALGIELVFETDVTSDEQYADADLIIACDGLNSRIRSKYAATYRPDVDTRRCRFVWLGTHHLFDAFTFAFEETPWGWFQAHAYRFDDTTSTFIVETPEEVWCAAGLDTMEKDEAIAFCEKLFARYLGGHKLMSNASHLRGSAQWIRFPRVVLRTLGARRRPRAGGADGRRRAHRALFDRLGHEARGRGCDRARASDRPHAGRFARRARRVRGDARHRGAAHPECCTQFDRMVRARRSLRQPAARAVRVFAVDAQPADQSREPALARPRLRRNL
jgi:hypothetical protein